MFAKFHKATISFAMTVPLPVLKEQLGSHWTDFHKILIFDDFPEVYRDNSSLIEI
jgi:hypothetical protein